MAACAVGAERRRCDMFMAAPRRRRLSVNATGLPDASLMLGPLLAHQVLHRVGQRHVVEVGGHLVAVL